MPMLFIFAFFLIIAVFVLSKNISLDKDVFEILPEELINLSNDAGYVFVDVREDHELKAGTIETSINLPLSTLKRNYKILPNNKTIILICRTGKRSLQALSFLKDQGYDSLLNLKGGIVSWQKAGFNLFKE